MEIVQDTNVFVAALRSQEGASAEVLDRCLARDDQAIMGAALLAEYEELVQRDSLWHDVPVPAAEREMLFDNFVTHVITERQAEARFVVRQKRGNPARGRKLLAEIRQRIASGAQ